MKKINKITYVILMLLFLCLIIGIGLGKREPEKMQYGLREEPPYYWPAELLPASKDSDYAYAFIWAGDEAADMIWAFPKDKETLVKSFAEEKENMRQKEENAVLWYFVKLRMEEDIHGTDIYDYLKQNLSEEKYEYYVETMGGESAYCIKQACQEVDEKGWYTLWPKRKAFICDGYLYLLTCDKVTEKNRETAAEEIAQFQSYLPCNNAVLGGGHFMDIENLYWIDHKQRVTELENPKCMFIEEAAWDAGWNWNDVLKGYFGMLKEAEYWVKLSPDMPEMTVSFQFMGEVEGDYYETYLRNYDCMHENYRMEVRMAEDGSLFQEETVPLSICCKDMVVLEKWGWKEEMISFEDLDEDGYLDMKMLHPNYVIAYGQTEGYHEYYWLWNPETEKFEKMGDASQALLKASREQEADMDAQTLPDTLTYIVEEGDCLWKLAKKYYGNGNRWWEIYEYNQETIGDNPSLILPGKELAIPK